MSLNSNSLKELWSVLPERVSTQKKDLVAHAGDLWPRRLILRRLKKEIKQPLAVVTPISSKEVQILLKWANEKGVSVIPFGGGSGVCGGVEVIGDSIALDLKKLNQILEINDTSLYVKVGAGILGGELEKRLNERGLTLCHFPASFFISTVGGWISTRASGQMSTAYGSIEDILLSLKVVLPNGALLETKLVPRSATGPDLKELFLGGEGSFGVVTEATCGVRKIPPVREFLSFSFEHSSKGLLGIRTLLQSGISPAVVRLYDELDTALQLSEIGLSASGNLLLLIFEGTQAMVQFQKEEALKLFSKEGKNLGEKPAKHWWAHRFDLNDQKLITLLSQEGVILDTIEVAATWDDLEGLYQGVKEAIGSTLTVMAHFSHFYLTGGSIYFTVVGNVDEEKALETYDHLWQKAMEAVLVSKGTISHHHGIGLLRKDWIQKELGSEGYALLSQIKKAVDPKNILNPGKLI